MIECRRLCVSVVTPDMGTGDCHKVDESLNALSMHVATTVNTISADPGGHRGSVPPTCPNRVGGDHD